MRSFYIYDGQGNIVRSIDIFTSKEYNWHIQGNPTSYLGHTLTWEKGRQLKRFDDILYTYNANGIRTSKTVDNVRHTYTLDGTKILKEEWLSNKLIPLYDNEDSVCGIEYNGTPYYFQKNLQGDVIAIVDKRAQVIANYSYDAWGVCTITRDDTSIGIADINPFRYRSYFYDRDTSLYYLQSRYYDASVGRFVNGDLPEFILIKQNTLLYSLFEYCGNDSINDSDISGCLSAKQAANSVNVSWLLALFIPILYANYSKGLVAVGAYTAKVVSPITIKAFWWKPILAATIIVAAVAIVVGLISIYFSKASKKSAKERATNAPSWLAGAMNAMPPHLNEKAQAYAKRLLDAKYGRGKWSSGPNTEYSKIVKYLQRNLGMK